MNFTLSSEKVEKIPMMERLWVNSTQCDIQVTNFKGFKVAKYI